MFEWLRSWFSDPLAKLASVVLATLVWVYVQGDAVHETRLPVRVVWRLPDGQTTIEPLPETIAVQVRGTHAATRRSADEGLRATIDLTGLGGGHQEVPLTGLQIEGLRPGVEVLGVSPATLAMDLDERIRRNVKVEPSEVGDPAEGFAVAEVTFEPPVVELEGARTALSVLRAVRTAPIDVSGLAADAQVSARLELPRGVALAPGERTPIAAVSVRPAAERVTFSSVPVYVWRRAGWRATVDAVEVVLEGPARTLEQVRPEQVVAFVQLPEDLARSEVEASFGPSEGVRLRVLHPDDAVLRVVKVTPPRVKVVGP